MTLEEHEERMERTVRTLGGLNAESAALGLVGCCILLSARYLGEILKQLHRERVKP